MLKIGDVIEYTNGSGQGYTPAIGSVGIVVDVHPDVEYKETHSCVRWISRTCPKWTGGGNYESVADHNVKVIGHVDPREMFDDKI